MHVDVDMAKRQLNPPPPLSTSQGGQWEEHADHLRLQAGTARRTPSKSP
jgi:hypothetical protein